MNAFRRWASVAISIAALVCLGCSDFAKVATEKRELTAAHIADSAINVRTTVGAVEVISDSLVNNEVRITANVSASAHTQEEAEARLKKIVVRVNRRDDQVLEVAVEPAEDGEPMHGGCALSIRLPDAKGVTVRVGTGSVTLKGLSGDADVQTGVGAIELADHKGGATVSTGTGAISCAIAPGSDPAVNLSASLGAISLELPASATGTIEAATSLGAISIDGPRQPRSVSGSVSGERTGKTVVLAETGPKKEVRTETGAISITLK